MLKLILQSARHLLLWTVLTGLVYPAVVTVIAQLAFAKQADGSLVERDGKLVGSALLAQQFQGTNYFWPRPSADTYATVPSGASNLGPTSGQQQTNVLNNLAAFRSGNNLATNAPVPADMVYASGSGLDPQISPEAARLQLDRVAAARRLPVETVRRLVAQFTEPPQWGFLGESRVNVLLLNLALDALNGRG
jgi:K+-transporting ATPase ATPase C chain